MKKLLILVLVLGLASAANATMSFEDDAITVTTSTTPTFNIVSDNTAAVTSYVGNAPGLADLTGMVANSNAGPDSIVLESPYSYNGYWGIESKDNDADTWDIVAGTQFVGTLTVGGTQGSYSLKLYDNTFTNVIDTLAITIVPEPMTIALLGLGGLFLRRRK